ncbi:hypothetical protein QBC46DRAFT_399991 [Diplogelasinospora grovesii]|uniref:Chitin synthase activator n=1 Tax=Diplogelasinospora grovesii TaxID=303347 RepID=A0AAN6RZ19_9PEZI|nr:hypothetical protein QBC46DRAFT_399991 [Diplogelasinospora grovesii]
MPEVPQNMQEDLQRMELEAREVEPGRASNSAALSPTSSQYPRNSGQDTKSFKPFQSGASGLATMDAPSFSPFPKVKGENIPPSDEEKEEILHQARSLVLHSNNVAMQVTWARDTLIWVDVAAEQHARDWKRDGKGRERPPTPKTEHDLRVDAINIIEYLASQGHPEATFMKGKWLEFGKFGFRENKREAYALYKTAAENGCGRAEYRLGMLYENTNDVQNAIRHYNLGVKLKDSASHYRLGMMHLMGQHGHQKDYLQGLEMIERAADSADEDAPQGAYVYGLLIARELPDINIPENVLPCDLSSARQYIEKAAYLGFAKAQLKMGQAYELGQLGCDFKPAYSLHYYGLAARQGQPEASLGVSRWFLFGFEGFFAKNELLAYKYAQDAANAGLATGEFAMGYYHEIGIHVQKDVSEARRWYEKAAEHGNSDAKGRLESLSQSKLLTKADHETTTLTRIKSQYGSQRGKRPDRFTKQNDVMPTLSESDNGPPVPEKPLHASPRHAPTIVEDRIDFPDPSRANTMNRPPAFTVNLDSSQSLPVRPKSAAPYPEDDRPPPLSLRPKSTAPYPEDDTHGQKPLSPYFNPSIRPSVVSGPAADRPMSAFGIRPLSPQGPLPGPQQPNLDPRGRPPPGHGAGTGWEPQVPAAYRQPSPGPARQQDYRRASPHQQQPQYDLPSQRLGAASVGPGVTIPAGAAPIGDPTRNRLQKTQPSLPNVNKPVPVPQPGQGPPMAGYGAQPQAPYPGGGPTGMQPGRDYGPRASSRPVSDNYGSGGYGSSASLPLAGNRVPSASSNGSFRPERLDSLPGAGHPGGGAGGHARLPSGGSGGGGGGAPLKARPGQMDNVMAGGGRASAPPAQSGRPTPGSGSSHGPSPGPGFNSPAPSNASTTNLPGHGGRPKPAHKPTDHPDGKTIGQGPATFEEMGIPQGKNESDCVVM